MSEKLTGKAFSDGIAAGKVTGGRCETCRSQFVPPRLICPVCGSTKVARVEYCGEGVVEAYTVNKTPSSKFRDVQPLVVGIVRLREGPSISGMIVTDKPDEIRIGMAVKFNPVKRGEKAVLAFISS